MADNHAEPFHEMPKMMTALSKSCTCIRCMSVRAPVGSAEVSDVTSVRLEEG